jgi:hypothetical protein
MALSEQRKDARFEGTRIVAVYLCDDGTIEVTATCEHALWLNPTSQHADADGWVRSPLNLATMVNLFCPDSELRAAHLETLERWRNEQTVVTGLASSERVGFINELAAELVTVPVALAAR